MAAEFSVDNGEVVITMTWQNSQEVIERVVFDAAAYLFAKGFGDHGTDEEPIVFGDLNAQQKLNLVYNHFTQVAKDAADTWVSVEAQRIAREATIPHEL